MNIYRNGVITYDRGIKNAVLSFLYGRENVIKDGELTIMIFHKDLIVLIFDINMKLLYQYEYKD